MPRPETSCSMSRDHLASAAQVAANAPAIGFLRHPSSPDRGGGLGTHTVRGTSGCRLAPCRVPKSMGSRAVVTLDQEVRDVALLARDQGFHRNGMTQVRVLARAAV
jgi:hypothetical protein